MASKIILILIIAGTALTASAGSGSFTVYGMGSISCGKFSSFSKESVDRKVAEQWIVGFISAKNEEAHFSYEPHEKGYLEGLDYEAIVRYVANYCNSNPLDPLYNGVNALNYELMRRHTSKQ